MARKPSVKHSCEKCIDGELLEDCFLRPTTPCDCPKGVSLANNRKFLANKKKIEAMLESRISKKPQLPKTNGKLNRIGFKRGNPLRGE
jgi:hypothetical protein